jgi:hypothetical protein
MAKIDWKEIVRAVAPTLATALGGPLAGIATSEISNAILGKSDGTEDEFNEVLSKATPEMFVKLKETENTFKLKMKELEVDVDRIAYENTKSAREREVSISKHRIDRMPKILAFVAVMGFFGVMYALFVKTLPEGLPRDAFLILLGTLTKIVSDLYNYYFGSSSGSDRKTDMLHDYLRNGKAA